MCPKAAELGHVEAQFQLALLLSVAARGTESTNRVVFSKPWWWQGESLFREMLGVRNRVGAEEAWAATNPVAYPALESESWKWCRRAAGNTNVDAALRLALHCENGQDYVEAARWWGLGAEQGSISATIHLADMYDRGE